MALSWLNLLCVLKAAIVTGKRTLATLASLPRRRDRSKALLRVREPIFASENLAEMATTGPAPVATC